jgi:multiple sugar transport system permease protein
MSRTLGPISRRVISARGEAARTFAVFVLPTVIVFGGIVLVPILWTLSIGLTNERATRPTTSFVGFDNVVFLLGNETFQHVLSNTVIITVIVVIITNVLGLAVALLIRRQGWFYNLLRSVFFTPVILSSVVVSVIWRSLLVDDGLFNSILRGLGVTDPPGWLSDPAYAVYTVAGIIVWQLLGFAVVVYLAGLSGIPEDIEEAASIDGAGAVRRFRSITWPLLAPSLTIVTVMLMISAFKVYDQIAVLTAGGPGTNGTATIAYEVIRTAFSEQRAGLASAMAAIMLVIVGVASAVILRLLQRREVTF